MKKGFQSTMNFSDLMDVKKYGDTTTNQADQQLKFEVRQNNKDAYNADGTLKNPNVFAQMELSNNQLNKA